MKPLDVDFDPVIVPAREQGFQRVFMGERKWYRIRLSTASRARLKHVAAYRTAPISAVTHVADVRAVVPLDDGRWAMRIEFGAVREAGPIRFISDGARKTLQTPRLTSLEKLLIAGSLNSLLSRRDG